MFHRTRGFLWTLTLFLLLWGLSAAAQITVGVLAEDAPRFEPYVREASQAGLKVTLDKFSEAALQQQVLTLAALGRARIEVAQVLTKWLPQVQGRLLDLAPYVKELQAAGVELYSYGNIVIGVKLPWRDDAFLAILAGSRNVPQALEFLKRLGAGAPGVTPLTLSVGPLVVGKPTKKHAGVDGALEGFVGVLRQAVPQGLLIALSHIPAQAQEAVRRVAEMWGIPLSPDGTAVTVVLEPLETVAPTALGAKHAEASALGLQKAVVPLDQLETFLAQAAGKARVRLPFEPVALAATSQGVGLVGAAAFHAQGIRGAGVKIAVIDVGFAGLSQSQARGDLPHALVTRDFTGTGVETGLSHGTAVAEIVYDTAPAATLYLVKIGNEVDLDNAITYCITEGVHIIVHALGWFNTSFYDGTGTIAQIVNRAADAGILWVQAAGNFGLRHYGPTFTDTNGDGWHDTDVTFTANAGERILLYLTWDSWPQAADDYDLYLFDPAGNLLASSTKTQAGAEQPTERISTMATMAGTYRARIQKVFGATRRLAFFSVHHNLSSYDAASSLVTPADVAAALSVAAIGWQNYSTGPAQPYSSRGPTKDGRQKPDLSAPDNVTTGVSYYNPFPGTSAAAPHVAGVAALLKSESTGLSASELRTRILSFCVPMGDPHTYGAGRLEARPQPVAQPDLIIDSITYTPSAPTVGSTVTFTVVVRNQGNAPAGAFSVRLQGAGPSQDRTVSSLAAGASITLTFSLPLSRTPEAFTATADVLGQVAESNEGNNTRQVTVTGVVAMPDLVVDSITYTPSAPTVGSTVTFTVVVRNQGNAPAGAFSVRLQGAGPSQDRTVSSLAAGASITLTFSLPLSRTPEAFTATADVLGQVAESNEGNNTKQVTITGVPATPQGQLSTDKSTYSQGETVQIIFRNTGNVTITLPNSAPWLIKNAFGQTIFAPVAAMVLTPVEPGETRTWTWNGRDTDGNLVPPGTYTVELATVNAGTFRVSFAIQAPALPDLVVDSVTYTPSAPTVGSTVTFTVVVRNQGNAPAGAFSVRLQGAGPSQDRTVSSLAAGASITLTFSLPLSRTPETFTATADVLGQVAESNEGNNIRQVTITGVVGLPDLVVESLTYTPTSPTVGTTLSFQITVRNQGGAPAGLFYISISGLAGTQYAQVSNLAAGDRVTVSLALPLSASGETFTATADATNRVREADEGNNSRQVTVTAAPPPLSLSISTDKTSYAVGEAVRITLNLSRPSHVYVVELNPAGRALLLFPNHWERDPRLPAGTTILPRLTTYVVRASEPTGTSRLVAFAADRAIPLFPTSFPSPSFPVLSTNGAAFLSQVRSWISANVPAGSWAEASTQITVAPLVNQPPVARFTFAPAEPVVNQWITFDATSSYDPDGSIVSYRWDFGDGATATGARVTKRYATAGTFTVTLSVTDNRGASASTSQEVRVMAPNQPPVASFTFSPANPDPGQTVAFDASASSDPDGTIASYAWSFGDGATGSGITVTHVYASAGTYTVTLTVTDNLGATGTATRTIQVGPPPPTLPGMPTIDRPGIYVWGDPELRWHVTVAGSAAWPSARPFRVVLSSHGTLADVAVTPGTAPAPTISADRRSIRWEGTIGSGWVDLRFRLTGSGAWILQLELYLDLDGDGDPVPRTPAEARSMVFLRAKKVNPPYNPLLFLTPEGVPGVLYPVQNFRIARGTLSIHVVTTTIETLEGGAP